MIPVRMVSVHIKFPYNFYCHMSSVLWRKILIINYFFYPWVVDLKLFRIVI